MFCLINDLLRTVSMFLMDHLINQRIIPAADQTQMFFRINWPLCFKSPYSGTWTPNPDTVHDLELQLRPHEVVINILAALNYIKQLFTAWKLSKCGLKKQK